VDGIEGADGDNDRMFLVQDMEYLSLMISKSSAYRSHIRERQLRPRLLIVKDFMLAAAHPINVCLYGLQRP
jgi:hypothetical protein